MDKTTNFIIFSYVRYLLLVMRAGGVGGRRKGRWEVGRLEVGERGLRAAEPAAAEPEPAAAEALLGTTDRLLNNMLKSIIIF